MNNIFFYNNSFNVKLILTNILLNNISYSIYAILFLVFLLYLASKKTSPVKHNLNKIDKLTGVEFENYMGEYFKKIGLNNVEVTKASGDFGVDIIFYKKNKKYVCQTKRYNKPVGIKAIQEVVSGRIFYKANCAVAITNSFYTNAAIQLAKECNVILIDRNNFKNGNINIR